jgi:hypothetical protein
MFKIYQLLISVWAKLTRPKRKFVLLKREFGKVRRNLIKLARKRNPHIYRLNDAGMNYFFNGYQDITSEEKFLLLRYNQLNSKLSKLEFKLAILGWNENIKNL